MVLYEIVRELDGVEVMIDNNLYIAVKLESSWSEAGKNRVSLAVENL